MKKLSIVYQNFYTGSTLLVSHTVGSIPIGKAMSLLCPPGYNTIYAGSEEFALQVQEACENPTVTDNKVRKAFKLAYHSAQFGHHNIMILFPDGRWKRNRYHPSFIPVGSACVFVRQSNQICSLKSVSIGMLIIVGKCFPHGVMLAKERLRGSSHQEVIEI